MTRTKKIELIKKFRPHLYASLQRQVPHLVDDPDNAIEKDTVIYNRLVREEAEFDKNNALFAKNFTF